MSLTDVACSLPLFLAGVLLVVPLAAGQNPEPPSWLESSKAKLEKELGAKYGPGQVERVRRGLRQAGEFWRASDGDVEAFEEFARRNFAGTQPDLDTLFTRYQTLLEQLDGHMLEIVLALRKQTDLSLGPVMPYDEVFAGYNPGAHLSDDLFANKLAFAVLLNFPLTTLSERLEQGAGWSRRQWAEARLAQRFSTRVPAEVNQAVSEAVSRSEQYISGYNIWMHHLVDDGGGRLFPPKMRLLSHWNLRDQIRADYAEKDGLARQRSIATVMEHIVRQTIPQAVIDNPAVDWNPVSNRVQPSSVKDFDQAPANRATAAGPEPDTRYRVLLEGFRALRRIDPYSPAAPHAHRAQVRRRSRAARGACAGDFRARGRIAAGSQSGRAHREAAGTAARALRHLVQRLQAGRRAGRSATGPDHAEAVSDRGGVSAGHAAHVSGAGVFAGTGALPGREHRSRSGARLRARLGLSTEHHAGAPAHARGRGWDGLQGLQHRGSRDGAHRRADLLTQEHRLLDAERRAQYGVHPRRSPSYSRPRTSNCWAWPAPRRRTRPCAR